MSALAICLYVGAGLESVNSLFLITRVGTPGEKLEKAYTGRNVALTVACNAFFVVVTVLAAMRLR